MSSNAFETYALVEMRTVDAAGGGKVEAISNIVRTYLTERRANEDLALMKATLPDMNFRVLCLEHLDN